MFSILLQPVFKRIQYIIAGVWAFTALTITLSMFFHLHPLGVFIVTIILLAGSYQFSKRFPDWYRGYLFREMSAIKANPTMNYYREGNYTPTQVELFEENLVIEGEIPKEIEGVYLRNGPNPAFLPISYTFPMDGDGMLHAVEISGGQASYRNKYVETKGLKAERKAGEALYGGIGRIMPTDPKLTRPYGDMGPVKNSASIHILNHAGRRLALYDAACPYEVSETLETIGEWKPKGRMKPLHMNAHTRKDPITGELFAFAFDLEPPYLKYYVFNAKGQLMLEKAIDKAYPTFIHDFVLTPNYLVFFDCPALFDAEQLKVEGQLLDWRPDLNTIVLLVHRETHAVTHIEMDPFFVYHTVNGYEEDGKLLVDYVRHETFTLGDALHTDFSGLHRMEIELKTNRYAHHLLYDYRIEFPRVNEAFIAKPYRYIYAPLKTQGHIRAFHALLKYDLKTRKAYIHNFGEHQEIDEAVFIPNVNDKKNDELAGWLGLFVYDREKDSSEFVILDAKQFTEKPQARIKLPQRVPHGLHGIWISSITPED